MANSPWPRLKSKLKKRRSGRPQRSLTMESLEGRQMLSAISLTPAKDNTLIENSSGSRSNGAGDIFVGLNADQNRIRRGLIDFDVANSVPAGATINSVSLAMYVDKTKVGNLNVGLHKTLADWGEAGSSGDGNGGSAQTGDASWLHTYYSNQFWTTPGGDFSANASAVQSIGSSGTTYTWSSTQMVADVQAWLDDPGTDHGWLLMGDETQRSSKRFASRETSNAAQRPVLTIDYTEGGGNAPTITSSDTVSVLENTTAVQTVTANDPDGDIPTFGKTGGADAALFNLNANTGVLTFNSAPDFEIADDANGDNVYEVQVIASDGTNDSLPQTIFVTVTGVNDNAPVITSSDTATVPENTTAVQAVTASDADGDPPTFSKTGGADAALFNLDVNTGLLTFNSAPDFEIPGDANGDNVYEVQVTASDGTNDSVPQLILVTVTGVPEATSKADIVGRTSDGEWWAARSDGTQFINEFVADWPASETWQDVQLADVNGDGQADILGRNSAGDWYVSLSDQFAQTYQRWGHWSPSANWQDVQTADVDGDGLDDLVGRVGGDWWVAQSTGTYFTINLWTRWSNAVVWEDVRVGDFDGDGKSDIAGRTSGDWWVARSDGSRFVNERWSNWSNAVAWEDVLVGDFDGNGSDDLAGRTSGNWWLAKSAGTHFVTEYWGNWSNAVTWSDVSVGDFDGDGSTDIAGQTDGRWWLARSNQNRFLIEYWGQWSAVAWQDVSFADFDGDGDDDIAGRLNGQWWVAKAQSTNFSFEHWGQWGPTTWNDVMAGVHRRDDNGASGS